MFTIKLVGSSILLCFFTTAFCQLENLHSDLLPGRDVCGKPREADRIYGGEECVLGEFPWMTLLGRRSQNRTRFNCGGTLINNRYVLTAAHCIHDYMTFVRLGEHDLSTDIDCEGQVELGDCSDQPRDIEIEEKIVHEYYNRDTFYADIALLRLKEEVQFTEFISPVCLPLSDTLRSKSYVAENVTVAGWGATEKGSKSQIKLKVELPVVSKSNCIKAYRKYRMRIADTQICAGGEGGKDSCQGDSGGPLMYHDKQPDQENFILCGVVSFGYNCGLEGVYGVYTRVGNYVDWIIRHIKA